MELRREIYRVRDIYEKRKAALLDRAETGSPIPVADIRFDETVQSSRDAASLEFRLILHEQQGLISVSALVNSRYLLVNPVTNTEVRSETGVVATIPSQQYIILFTENGRVPVNNGLIFEVNEPTLLSLAATPNHGVYVTRIALP